MKVILDPPVVQAPDLQPGNCQVDCRIVFRVVFLIDYFSQGVKNVVVESFAKRGLQLAYCARFGVVSCAISRRCGCDCGCGCECCGG